MAAIHAFECSRCHYLPLTGFLKPEDRVVLFNTGTGNKYTDVFAKALGLPQG